MIQDMQKIRDSLIRIYEILEFTPAEIEETLSDLDKIRQLAVSSELLKSLSDTEVKTINDSNDSADEERYAVMEGIVHDHSNDEDFKSRVQAASQNVLNEHIAYLKTCAVSEKKEEISKILAGIE